MCLSGKVDAHMAVTMCLASWSWQSKSTSQLPDMLNDGGISQGKAGARFGKDNPFQGCIRSLEVVEETFIQEVLGEETLFAILWFWMLDLGWGFCYSQPLATS